MMQSRRLVATAALLAFLAIFPSQTAGQLFEGGVGGVLGILIAVFILLCIFFVLVKGIKQIREREVMIIERFGRYKTTLDPGIRFIVPFVDQPKTFWHRYHTSNEYGQTTLHRAYGLTRVGTQNEVFDFPRQNVITRDNASVYLDAVLSYRISSPYTMIYGTQNLPYMLSKLLQAQIRNVAGELDIDQIIEDSSQLNRIGGVMGSETQRWGVEIVWVRIQKVEALELTDVLAEKKNADLKNQEVIIGAKAHKQTAVIEAEGERDSMIRRAEGQATEMISRARGRAQAITNAANAEARSVKEIARVVSKAGENPARYLLALKYLEALKAIVRKRDTKVVYLPKETALIQTAQNLGVNTAVARS